MRAQISCRHMASACGNFEFLLLAGGVEKNVRLRGREKKEKRRAAALEFPAAILYMLLPLRQLSLSLDTRRLSFSQGRSS